MSKSRKNIPKRQAPQAPDTVVAISPEVCSWYLFEYEMNAWETSCGNNFTLIGDGTPSESGFWFCPYCGKKIKEEVV